MGEGVTIDPSVFRGAASQALAAAANRRATEGPELREVVWFDAFADATANWTSIYELETKPRQIRSVGYVIPDVIPGYLTLAQSLDADTDCVGQVIHIPTVCVLEVL